MDSIEKFVTALLDQKGLEWLQKDVSLIFALIGVITVLFTTVRGLIRFAKKIQEKHISYELDPYFTDNEVKMAVKNFVETECQNIPPSITDEPGQNHAFITKQNLIEFFIDTGLKKSSDKFYFILADAGMGKTTFMLNLYLRYRKKNWLLKSLNIMNQKPILLFPLGYDGVLNDINEIEDSIKKEAVLLLDGFDEDQKAVLNYSTRLNEIIKASKEFNKIIITSRTQFFPTQDKEPFQTGVLKFGVEKGSHLFGRIYISPFTNDNIDTYLKKKYSFIHRKRRQYAKSMIRYSSNLAVRPMLLNYIDDLVNEIETNNEFKYYRTYMIYEALIKRWINREASRQAGEHEEFSKKMMKFSESVSNSQSRKIS